MPNPFKWLQDIRAKKKQDRYIHELSEKWNNDVWEWHKPFQKESIEARGPFLRLVEQERAKHENGEDVDKEILQKAFSVVFDKMLDLDNRIINAFVDWYHSDDGAHWRLLLEEAGVDQEFLANAGDVLRSTPLLTMEMCEFNSKDLLDSKELYELCNKADA